MTQQQIDIASWLAGKDMSRVLGPPDEEGSMIKSIGVDRPKDTELIGACSISGTKDCTC